MNKSKKIYIYLAKSFQSPHLKLLTIKSYTYMSLQTENFIIISWKVMGNVGPELEASKFVL